MAEMTSSAAEQITCEIALERTLLRRGLTRRKQTATSCADCGRTPLAGERVYTFARGECVCELCRVLRRTEPVSVALQHGHQHGSTVRVLRAA
jgi:hypothetical protein